MTSRRITLRIVGGDGRPVSQSSVTVIAGSVPFPEVALLPNEAGIVSLSLPASAHFTLRAISSDGRSGEAMVSTSAAEDQRMDIVVT